MHVTGSGKMLIHPCTLLGSSRTRLPNSKFIILINPPNHPNLLMLPESRPETRPRLRLRPRRRVPKSDTPDKEEAPIGTSTPIHRFKYSKSLNPNLPNDLSSIAESSVRDLTPQLHKLVESEHKYEPANINSDDSVGDFSRNEYMVVDIPSDVNIDDESEPVSSAAARKTHQSLLQINESFPLKSLNVNNNDNKNSIDNNNNDDSISNNNKDNELSSNSDDDPFGFSKLKTTKTTTLGIKKFTRKTQKLRNLNIKRSETTQQKYEEMLKSTQLIGNASNNNSNNNNDDDDSDSSLYQVSLQQNKLTPDKFTFEINEIETQAQAPTPEKTPNDEPLRSIDGNKLNVTNNIRRSTRIKDRMKIDKSKPVKIVKETKQKKRINSKKNYNLNHIHNNNDQKLDIFDLDISSNSDSLPQPKSKSKLKSSKSKKLKTTKRKSKSNTNANKIKIYNDGNDINNIKQIKIDNRQIDSTLLKSGLDLQAIDGWKLDEEVVTTSD